jgi:hypothetical protein
MVIEAAIAAIVTLPAQHIQDFSLWVVKRVSCAQTMSRAPTLLLHVLLLKIESS